MYRAHDPRLGRDVAIKVLLAAPDDERLARFEREARATALLAHPNILTLFDIGTYGGTPFIVCEYLEGETLRGRLERGPLGADEALALALQLTRGVAAAHALRIVHRDLKPENIILTRDGTLKILDFGLAKLQSQARFGPDAETLHLSSADALVGTPAYMAPEQIRNALVDERTDLFAIGTMLFEMLSGANPFARPTPVETLAAILHEDAAPQCATLVPAVAPVVARCLDKRPNERYHTASELAVALDAARKALHQPSAPAAGPTAVPPPGGTSIAVLPFLDMSAARDQGYLCDGIADELINALSHVDDLRVTARSSSFQFKSAGVDGRAVGARLGVDAVLEGGVRKSGDRLRITVQLVNVADGYQRWSERFDGSIDDVFAFQDRIAERVAITLRGLLSGRERQALRRPGTEAEAYESYLRGRQLFRTATLPLVGQARALFEHTLAIDPGYAPAYAGLAEVQGWMFEWAGGGEPAGRAADEASLKAIELGPGLSEAHVARAAALSLHRRYDEAKAALDEALRLNPNSFDAHYLYARICFACGENKRSSEFFRRGAEIQREDYQCLLLGSQSLRLQGRKEESAHLLREGIRRAERLLELDPTNVRALSLGGSSLVNDNQVRRGLEWCERALEIDPEDTSAMINGACAFAVAGKKEEAIALIERTFARGIGKRDWIEHDPDFDSLRDDPRFQALLDRLA